MMGSSPSFCKWCMWTTWWLPWDFNKNHEAGDQQLPDRPRRTWRENVNTHRCFIPSPNLKPKNFRWIDCLDVLLGQSTFGESWYSLFPSSEALQRHFQKSDVDRRQIWDSGDWNWLPGIGGARTHEFLCGLNGPRNKSEALPRLKWVPFRRVIGRSEDPQVEEPA